MRIVIVTPAPPGSRAGNRVTALRWAKLLRSLGHRVTVCSEYHGRRYDLLIALHASKSFAAMKAAREKAPDMPIVLALTGTDLYGAIHTDANAQKALHWAKRLILLQPKGIDELPRPLRRRARVIYQSVDPPRVKGKPKNDDFRVCVIGHLRPVKDPMRTAWAARLLPEESRIRVLHIGSALTEELADAARHEQETNPRYRWLGELPRTKALQILATCHLLSLTSKSEGGANVISEALMVDVPVVSSRIDGSIGLLGKSYPGYFPYADTQALADLMYRAEKDSRFYKRLQNACRRKRHLFEPEEERRRWKEVLAELLPDVK
ncbi:MAG: hypothetical protein KatS3mg105_3542 [Gemmatales bacterium]|nr:MAG: hypothetical protein KatS3mg105_3542 [Gemmatales bacterium]